MLSGINIKNILFLDVETVPIKENFEDLSATFQKLWEQKTTWQRKEEYSASEYYKLKAGIMAEFAKIICISVGYLLKKAKTISASNLFMEMMKNKLLLILILCSIVNLIKNSINYVLTMVKNLTFRSLPEGH